MKRSQGRSWFASLRRDGKLFAAVAGLALVFAMLQPIVPAQAAVADTGVICSTHAHGAGNDGVPGDHRDCPCCVFGHVCGGLPLLAKALTAHTPAFAPPTAVRHAPAVLSSPVAVQRIASSPPGIRAPPSL